MIQIYAAILILGSLILPQTGFTTVATQEQHSILSGAVLDLTTENYFSPIGNSGQSVYPILSGRGDWSNHGNIFETQGRGELMLILQSKNSAFESFFFEFPEAYVGYPSHFGMEGKIDTDVSLQLGRKLEKWNQMDEKWHLGVFQPRFRRDYLQPETVGLLGLFLTVQEPSFHFVAFGSPLFIPDRGVPVSSCNGGMICSTSPWFIPPSRRVTVLGEETQATYDLSLPSLGKMLLHPGAGFMARLGNDEGPWASVAYAYKPLNQLLLGYGGSLSLAPTEPMVPVTVYPRVLMHHVASAELGYEGKHWSTSLSTLAEKPLRDETPSDWTTQEISPFIAVSPTIEWHSAPLTENPLRLDMSYIRQWGGTALDSGPFTITGGSPFELRNSFFNALQGGFQTPVFAGFSLSHRVIWDIAHQGTVYSTFLSYQFLKTGGSQLMTLGLGTDFLTSVVAENTDTVPNDFIGRYRANDRIYVGATYGF